MKVNFFGDFKAKAIEKLQLADDLQNILNVADYNIVYLEAPVLSSDTNTRILKTGPNLKQDPACPAWLHAHRFNLISLANNHAMDYGEEALIYTRSKFNESLIFGAGTWDEAYRPCIFEKDNIKVAILGLAHYEFGMLADKWDKRYQRGVAWINHPEVDGIIQETRKRVDYLIVYAHAGLEYIEQPLPEWRDRYHSLIDLGCDAVIASHPHIIQGWEMYREKPIVYSLGNFFFPEKRKNPRQWYRSLCASLELKNHKVKLDITPICFSDHEISLDKSPETKEYIQRINDVLNNEELYMKYVNDVCLRLLSDYNRHFAMSGYAFVKDIKGFVRCLVNKYIRKKDMPSSHIENVLRCESHRWCFSRGLKLRDKYQ